MEKSKTVVVPTDQITDTVRKVVEYTDYPITTIGGRKLIRRVEKILMPNGRYRYRYPVTYIDMSPIGFEAPDDWTKDRVPGYEIVVAQ